MCSRERIVGGVALLHRGEYNEFLSKTISKYASKWLFRRVPTRLTCTASSGCDKIEAKGDMTYMMDDASHVSAIEKKETYQRIFLALLKAKQ